MASIEWPVDEKSGKVSTTATGKKIWASVFRALGDDAAAAALEKERDWRHKYPAHAVALTERMCAAPALCVAGARAGLALAHDLFETEARLAAIAAPLRTWRVQGRGAVAPPALPLGDLARWADAGSCEVDVPARCGAACDGAGALRKPRSDDCFVCFGATSEMGPARVLLALGQTVVGIARSGNAAKWQPLVDYAAASAGVLLLPTRSDAPDAGGCGADLLAEAGAIAAWLVDDPAIKAFDRIVVGNFVYMDGEKHVRSTLAVDAITKALVESRGVGAVAYAYLASPGTAYRVPEAIRDDAAARYAAAPAWQTGLSGVLRVGGGGYVANARAPINGSHVTDGIATIQGPSYCLAKTLQNWRAVVARADGSVVSANMAPPARTRSMTSNASVARWLDGVKNFPPNATFAPDVAAVCMAGLLLYDLSGATGHPADPAAALEHPLDVLQPAFHGGNPRGAFTGDSIGSSAVLTSFLF